MTSAADLSIKGQFSYSRLQKFQKCPGAFKLHYIDEVKSDFDTIEKFMGATVHSALEAMHNSLMAGTNVRMQDAIDIFISLWKQKYNPKFVLCVRDQDPMDYYKLGQECLKNYYLRYYPFPETTIENEMQVTFQIEGWKIRGYIDRLTQVDDVLQIHDFKTGSTLPTKLEVKHDMQLTLYEIGIRQMMKWEGPIRLIWHFVRHDKEFVTQRTPDQIEFAKERLLKMIDEVEEAIEMDHFPFRPNFMCDWCEYAQTCETYKEYWENRLQ